MVKTRKIRFAAVSFIAAALLAGTAATDTPVRDKDGYDAAWYALPANTPQNTHFDFKLKGYVFGLRMITAQYEGVLDNGQYTVRSTLKTSGLAALLKKLKIWAITDGQYSQSGLRPLTHTQQNLDKKSRRVEMAYDNNMRRVSVAINPPIGSQGIPPASPQERFEAHDTLSAILNIMMRQPDNEAGHINAPLCEGDVKVFDSKQHYALRMVKGETERKKFLGQKTDIINCNIYYIPISGFDPEDLPEQKEAETPVKIQLVKNDELDMYVPMRFSYKISGFKAVIKVTDMHVNGVSLRQ